MHYNREILSSVLRDMEREHTARTELFAQRREEVYARLPRVREIARELSGTAGAGLHPALAAADDPADADTGFCVPLAYSRWEFDEGSRPAVCADSGVSRWETPFAGHFGQPVPYSAETGA